MSTRYVWGKNNIKYPEISYSTTTSVSPKNLRPTYINDQCGGSFCSDYSRVIVGDKLYFKPEGTIKGFVFSAMIDRGRHPCSTYPYFIAADNGHIPGWALARSGTGYWTIYKSEREVAKTANYDSYDELDFDLAMYSNASEISKGTFIEYKSAQNYDEYPRYGIQDSYYYDYKGSDTIDPNSISYSKSELYSGEPVIINISPKVPTYGGVVYYQFSYSTNGGSTWTNIGSKTTETNKTITIPTGASQFQARALASDGWGFTSTTYVTGPNLPVSQIKAYATVGGKLMAGAKMYATVDGKIRQVQKGYVTVGGKVRKLF